MREHIFASSTRSAVGAFLLLLGAGLASSTAMAADAPLLRLGHYSAGNGLTGFVLDRLAQPVKLRFDGSDEIVALTPAPVKAGVTELKRDDGTVILRLDDEAGVILYGDVAPRDGVAAYIDQKAMPLVIAPATKSAAEDKAASIARQLKQDFNVTLPIEFEATGMDAQSEAWSAMADAAMVAGIAFREIVATPLGQKAVAAKLERVTIRSGKGPAIELSGHTLVIAIAADKPLIGRPSSARLKSVIGDLL